MAETTDRPYSQVYTFEDVWAALMETRERQEKTAQQMKETDRQMKETDLQMKKQMEEIDLQLKKQMKRLGRQMGDLHRRFGEMAEHLVAPSIAKRFNELGYRFESISPGGHRILDEQGKIKTEVDILLENGDCIVAVEVKAKVALKDIDHHVGRLDILRESRSKKRDDRKIHGAIAGAIFGTMEKEAALEAGFYVLEQSGDTMQMAVPEGFVPRQW